VRDCPHQAGGLRIIVSLAASVPVATCGVAEGMCQASSLGVSPDNSVVFWEKATQGQAECRGGSSQMDVVTLLTAHPAVLGHLIPGLLSLYKDIEYTERGNQFYEKFRYRFEITELLEWLWNEPDHRANWARIGAALLLCRIHQEPAAPPLHIPPHQFLFWN
jgi:hypothetical protein